MKTAISLPDPLYLAAERFAHDKGLSRSELYAHALQYYLRAHHYQGVTEALNEIYLEQPSALNPAFGAAQSRALPKEDW